MTVEGSGPAVRDAVPLTGIRRAAARKMIKAWEAPAFTLTIAVDMSAALTVKRRDPEATVTDRLIECCARALVGHPQLNAWYDDLAVTQVDQVNIGVAVATDAGLMVPVVQGADRLALPEIRAARRDLVSRARAGRLGRADVTGGTFTISNLGMQGIDRFTAILNVPQVAILAIGATTERYVRRDGVEAWVPQADFTLTCDHRAVDGATGAAFLTELRALIETP
ncbi:2-oxo acid dehydrogenase subunit E2 [Streptosporangium amethystogenes subsp. fukuiense]|uniref:2-oxo acid dehydrogenase subunit E2 n=1 Tax=Streptosporangium amethystogenes subsp. fukuiense TaxID=698418 RepID=A0ABW2TAW9_9ACTN